MLLPSRPPAWPWVPGARCRSGSRRWSPTASALSGFPRCSSLAPAGPGVAVRTPLLLVPKRRVTPRECPLTPPTSPYTVLLLSFHQSCPVRCLLRAQHLAGPPWSRPRLLSLVSTPGHLAPFCSSNTPSRGLLGATALAGPSGLGHWSRSKCHSSGRLSWSGTAILWDYGRRRGEVAGRTWECCSIATTQTELPVTRGTTLRGSTLPAPGGPTPTWGGLFRV